MEASRRKRRSHTIRRKDWSCLSYQKEFFEGRLLGADISSPDYAEVARLCGAEGYTVSTPGGTQQALEAALLAKQPAVIHVSIDPEALSALRKDLFKR